MIWYGPSDQQAHLSTLAFLGCMAGYFLYMAQSHWRNKQQKKALVYATIGFMLSFTLGTEYVAWKKSSEFSQVVKGETVHVETGK